MERDPRRLLQYLDTFFGVRNSIKGTPKEGVNFDLETLTYMTSHNRADQITEIIVKKMEDKGKVPFGIFECCSGIGGNTLSFLDNKNIQWVVSYEIRPERREMLKRNIAMYDLAKNNRSFVPDTPFAGVPEQYKSVNVVLYFDPPWLPANIKGHEMTGKEQYVLHGIKVGEYTLEQWIQSCPHCDLIVARVPPNYKLDPVPGFVVEELLIKNSLVLFITPVDKTKKIVMTGKEFVPQSPIKSPIKDEDEKDEKDWLNGLREFLRNDLLIKFIPEEKFRDIMTSDEAMKIWKNVFTHESYNANVGENYEELELLGDAVMDLAFLKYLYMKYPKITRSELTELKHNYLSKGFQGSVGLKWGLDKWLRTNLEKTTHIFEDLLEAFFGGINEIGDKVFKFGAGYGLAFNIINYMFKDIDIDISAGKPPPKTQMKEIFEAVGWGRSPEENFQSSENGVTATLSYTSAAMDTLRSLGVNLASPIIAIESGTTKKMASDAAYKVALERVRKTGITDDWINRVRAEKDKAKPELAEYWIPTQEKIRNNGLVSFYFKSGKTTKMGKYVQLIGVRSNNRLVILGTVGPVDDITEGKRQLFINYLK